MDTLAQIVGVTRQGLQKSIEQKTLRIDVAEKMAIALKLEPSEFVASFVAVSEKKSSESVDEKLRKILLNQEEILKLLQKKSEVSAL